MSRPGWRTWLAILTLGVFAGGVTIGWHSRLAMPVETVAGAPTPADIDAGAPPARRPSPPAEPRLGVDPLEDLRARQLTLPVQGVRSDQLRDAFNEARAGGRHEAIDILAARNTPVLAVENGVVAKLFLSKAGGITIYQFDPSDRYAYYYAHLERYAAGLHEGQSLRRGEIIGYVGTTGNAPKDTPHLHFAIFKLSDQKRWWEGTPINPFNVLR